MTSNAPKHGESKSVMELPRELYMSSEDDEDNDVVDHSKTTMELIGETYCVSSESMEDDEVVNEFMPDDHIEDDVVYYDSDEGVNKTLEVF